MKSVHSVTEASEFGDEAEPSQYSPWYYPLALGGATAVESNDAGVNRLSTCIGDHYLPERLENSICMQKARFDGQVHNRKVHRHDNASTTRVCAIHPRSGQWDIKVRLELIKIEFPNAICFSYIMI